MAEPRGEARGEWLVTHRGVVFPWTCDQFGHMNVRWYAHHFDDSSFQLWAMLGIDMNALKARGVHAVVARTTVNFIREFRAGALLVVRCGFTRVGTKSATYFQRMFNADSGVLHATQEGVEVFFDMAERTARPVPDDVRAILEANLVDPGET